MNENHDERIARLLERNAVASVRGSLTPAMRDELGDAYRARDGETVEAVADAYMVAALWSSTDDASQPLDASYGIGDIASDSRARMRQACVDFLERCAAGNLDLSPIEPKQIGHDLWLTRNGHGAGFWDRGLGDLGDRLTDIAKSFGESYLYVGDDGALHVDR